MKRAPKPAKPAIRLEAGAQYLTPSGRICRCVATTHADGQADEAELVYDGPGGVQGRFTLARPNWRLLQRVSA